ncbi:MAG: metal ABC transporter permease [Bacteroidales bacterium]|nr:metal ABC transporter permease [Bacteroidales bacterium]
MIESIFTYQFMTNAILSMIFLSIVAGIVGTYIVVRRMVFVAGGITHASFGGIGIACYLGMPPLIGALLFAVLTAVGIETLGDKGKVRPDSAIAMLWSLGMAIGVLFMFMTPGYSSNLMGFMFGDVLAVSSADVIASAVAAFTLVIVAVIFRRPILYVAFSPSFASLTRWHVRAISILMSIAVAVSLVMAIKAVGIILVLSLFTIPQSISNLFVKNMGHMMILSSIIALIGSLSGLAVAFVFDLPAGAAITAFLTIAFLIVKLCIRK